jgi:hypothetical protein
MMTLVLKQFTREMADKDVPIIADAFYEELFRVPVVKPVLEPDTTKSAQALQVAFSDRFIRPLDSFHPYRKIRCELYHLNITSVHLHLDLFNKERG